MNNDLEYALAMNILNDILLSICIRHSLQWETMIPRTFAKKLGSGLLIHPSGTFEKLI
jgi:hypothetical protein